MNYSHNLPAKLVSVFGGIALAVAVGVPAIAQTQINPGPSETPSGSPSVPGNSSVDDPGSANEDQSRPEVSRPGVSRDSSMPERDALGTPNETSNPSGPSAVPGEGFPGPSETPSGSPSVPGNSSVDDPGISGERMPERNTLNAPEMNRERSGSMEEGPSAVPGEGFPGPSETPSGSPSVPGVSGADDPGMKR